MSHRIYYVFHQSFDRWNLFIRLLCHQYLHLDSSVSNSFKRTRFVHLSSTFLTLYVPCIVTNYINKPTRCSSCMYSFYNFCPTLHVSNDNFVHHQEFMIYCICSSVQTMQTCLTARSYGWEPAPVHNNIPIFDSALCGISCIMIVPKLV